jgi:hypothetical protein
VVLTGPQMDQVRAGSLDPIGIGFSLDSAAQTLSSTQPAVGFAIDGDSQLL